MTQTNIFGVDHSNPYTTSGGVGAGGGGVGVEVGVGAGAGAAGADDGEDFFRGKAHKEKPKKDK